MERHRKATSRWRLAVYILKVRTLSKACRYYGCKSERGGYVYDFTAEPKIRKRLALTFYLGYILSAGRGLTPDTGHTNHEQHASSLSHIPYLPTWSAAADSGTAAVHKLSLHAGCPAFRCGVKMCPIGELVRESDAE